MLPPFPTWNNIHPQIVHFPIALLMVAGLFVVIELFRPGRAPVFGHAALLLLFLGTVGTFVAVASGEASQGHVPKTTAAQTTLHEHEELAERTRIIFSLLTLVYAAISLGPAVMKRRLDPRVHMIVSVIFLVGYAAGIVFLTNTAHQGGILVHEYGVHVHLPSR